MVSLLTEESVSNGGSAEDYSIYIFIPSLRTVQTRITSSLPSVRAYSVPAPPAGISPKNVAPLLT